MLFLFGENTKSRMSRTSTHARLRVDIISPFNDFTKSCKMKSEEPRTSENRRMRGKLVLSFASICSQARLAGWNGTIICSYLARVTSMSHE
jgi:hypothetical protein